jgi:hypothetical protein
MTMIATAPPSVRELAHCTMTAPARQTVSRPIQAVKPGGCRQGERSPSPVPCIMRPMHDYVGPPLDRQRLASVLTANGVSERAYHLYGAHQHDALVLDQRPQGWIIFYSERGGEDILATHASEDEACLDLLNRLLDTSGTALNLSQGQHSRLRPTPSSSRGYTRTG